MNVVQLNVVSTVHLFPAVAKIMLSREFLPVAIVGVQECFIFRYCRRKGTRACHCFVRFAGVDGEGGEDVQLA